MRNKLRAALGSYSMSGKRRVPSGRLWPNGEFSLGYTAEGEETGAAEEYAYTMPERWLSSEELDERLAAMHELLDAVDSFYRMSGELAASGLTLSNVWNSHKPTPPAKNGLKGLTGYGTKMVRNGCYLLEKRLGKDDCTMITLTVPTLGRAERQRVAIQWGVLVNRLVQFLSRALGKAGRSPAIVGCVEIQTARLDKYQQGYLHVHLVCPAHSNTGGRWAIDADALRTWWRSALERVVGHDLPSMPRVETAIVEKSIEAYLGKYLSKGTGKELKAFVEDLGEDAVPGQWWFTSSLMRTAIKSATCSGRNAGAVLDAVVVTALNDGDLSPFEYLVPVDCILDGRPVFMGYAGRLRVDVGEDIRNLLMPG